MVLGRAYKLQTEYRWESDMRDFMSKVAVITGAGSGMGRYLAVLLARSGCDVVICDVNEDALAGRASRLINI